MKFKTETRAEIDSFICTIRDQKVIIDADLALIYGVPTKRLNEQVRRNKDRFPSDFMFQLSLQEWRAKKGSGVHLCIAWNCD